MQSGGGRLTLGGALRMKTLVVNTSRAWSWADGLPPNIEVRASQMLEAFLQLWRVPQVPDGMVAS